MDEAWDRTKYNMTIRALKAQIAGLEVELEAARAWGWNPAQDNTRPATLADERAAYAQTIAALRQALTEAQEQLAVVLEALTTGKAVVGNIEWTEVADSVEARPIADWYAAATALLANLPAAARVAQEQRKRERHALEYMVTLAVSFPPDGTVAGLRWQVQAAAHAALAGPKEAKP